jgi:hypothetical protein
MAVNTVARLARSWFVATMIAICGVCKYDNRGLQRLNVFVARRQEQHQHSQTSTPGCGASSALYLPLITFTRLPSAAARRLHISQGAIDYCARMCIVVGGSQRRVHAPRAGQRHVLGQDPCHLPKRRNRVRWPR